MIYDGQWYDDLSNYLLVEQNIPTLGADHLITGGGGGGGVEENVPEHFIYFFQEQRQFIWPEVKNNFFLYNKIWSNFFIALELLVVSLKFVCTGYVAEWLVLMTLIQYGITGHLFGRWDGQSDFFKLIYVLYIFLFGNVSGFSSWNILG